VTATEQVLPYGHYLPATVTGNTVISAGMTPRIEGALAASARVGADEEAGVIGVERAAELAGQSVRRAINACQQALPEGGRLLRPVNMTVYIRSRDDFTLHSDVANGASAVLAACFDGHVGSRAAIGVSSLPGGSPVEVVLTAEWVDGEGSPVREHVR
jgi:enamine deaminase RidA (YjgF/YER057c/UK114 family)